MLSRDVLHSRFGETIEEYEIHNLLGQGGFANVYRAKCLRSSLDVAIKMIDKKLMEARKMTKRVREEVAIHSRLKHPSVIELYTFFEDSNYVYLVLELCHNGELSSYLKRLGHKCSENEAKNIVRQVVEGLMYLHSHNILHRDISLPNLLLTKDLRVKIADFGLATQLSRPDEKHMTMCGTPNYISPEVVTKSAHGLEIDAWSVGILLYTLLVGHPPFDTDAVKSTLTRVAMAPLEIPAHLSMEAKDLIQSLLQKNPEKRMQLRDVLTHPLMLKESDFPALNHRAYLSGSGSDSGVCTMTTSSNHTNSPGFSQSNFRVGPLQNQNFASSVSGPHHCASNSYSSSTKVPSGLDMNRAEFASALDSQPFHSEELFSQHHIKRSDDACYQTIRGTKVKEKEPEYLRSKFPSYLDENSSQNYIPSLPSKHVSETSRNHTNKNAPSYESRGCGSENSVLSGLVPPDKSFVFQSVQNLSNPSNDERFHHQHGPNVRSESFNHQNHTSLMSVRKCCSEGQETMLNNEKCFNWCQNLQFRPGCVSSAHNTHSTEMNHAMKGGIGVPPLNSTRLQPTRHRTKNAALSIVENGEVIVEIIKHKGAEEKVIDVCQISSDGLRVILYQPNKGKGIPLSNKPPPLPSEGADAIYSYESLPEKHWKKYVYASRFVALVKTKTPKITYYSPLAKCLLMENGPDADFEVYFYDGGKIGKTGKSVKITHSSGANVLLDVSTQTDHLDSSVQLMWKYYKQYYDHCRSLEMALSSVESGSNDCFPAIIGRRPNSTSVLSSSGKENQANEQYLSPPAQQLLSFEVSKFSCLSGVDSGFKHGFSGAPCRVISTTPFKKIEVPNIGIATETPNGEIKVEYHDGRELRVKQNGSVRCVDFDGSLQEFVQGSFDKLPSWVESRLLKIPIIVQHLASTNAPPKTRPYR
ncbi:unnamed protein product [Bemisia tabaci]|uniref:Serine/threonine-protein kinase PLK4 n=1 Tax=Bemisia tabaci TaxID=7038 RepID=A0A9P0ALQ1_BEMTA|nr:unnamed protein product [Bemisia tabaci]